VFQTFGERIMVCHGMSWIVMVFFLQNDLNDLKARREFLRASNTLRLTPMDLCKWGACDQKQAPAGTKLTWSLLAKNMGPEGHIKH